MIAFPIYMEHSLEHLKEWEIVLKELHRICKKGAIVHIKVPHLSCWLAHPYHRRGFGKGLFYFFNKYNNLSYKVVQIRLNWHKEPKNIFLSFLNKIVNFFGNISIAFTERIWCYWVGGFEEIEFVAIVVK